MANKVSTIQTSDGKVYTGKEVSRNDHAGYDIAAALFTLGLSDVLGGRSTPTVTVEVNDQKYSGKEVK